MSAAEAPRELVLASAGSGKTHWITSRLIALLAHGEDPERILASTFTRKAAGEILDRVLRRIAAAALSEAAAAELAGFTRLGDRDGPNADPEFWRSVLEETVRGLHRLNIGTLDAFFIRAAGAFESELGLPPGWRIPDEATLSRLRSRALIEVLAAADRGRMVEMLRLVSRGEVNRSVHARLDGMMTSLLAIEDEIEEGPPDPWSIFRQLGKGDPPDDAEVERLIRRLDGVELPRTKDGTEHGKWREEVDAIVDALRARDWDGLMSRTLCHRVATGELTFYRVVVEPDVQQAIEAVLDATRRALRPLLGDQVEALGSLARSYRDHFRALQRSSGRFGFADVTRLIGSGRPLGERTDLYYRLDARTRHILLDEFQDTSLPQWEALAPLFDEILADDGRAAVVVADPKQSIYGWRGAEPGIVHAVRDRYHLRQEALALSRRSSPVVLDLVNRIFTRIDQNPGFRGEQVFTDAAVRWLEDFSEHRAHHAERPGHVRLEVGPEDEGRSSDRPSLCRRVAERVREIREAAPDLTIGVLTRTNTAVARLFLELREQGLAVSQEGGNPLTDSAACEAILALLRLADHSGDTIARYHVSRTPLGRALRFTDHRDDAAARALSARIRRRLLDHGYGRTVVQLSRRLAPLCDAREARRLSQLGELAHRWDAAGSTLRPLDFVRLAETERVEDRATADIRVMTVHQSKGLEFDIVVLPQLDDSIIGRGPQSPAIPYRRDPIGRISAVMPYAGKELQCLFPEIETAERQRRAAVVRDGLSTLYVALTRARYAVHMVVAPDGKKGPGSAITPARLIREALHDTHLGEALPQAREGSVLFEAGSPDWFRDPRVIPHGGSGGRLPAPLPDPKVLPEGRGRLLPRQTPSDLHGESVSARSLLRLDNTPALERGSLIHGWLEAIEWIDEGIPGDEELRRIGRRILRNPDPELIETGIVDLRRWLAERNVRDVLSRSRYGPGASVAREAPFVHRRDGVLIEGVIDRLVLRREGKRVVEAEIIDYKTDRISAGDVEGMVEHYRLQLLAYMDAVTGLYRVPVERCRATLVFLEPGVIRTVGTSALSAPLDSEPSRR